jgi:hypothetical protein
MRAHCSTNCAYEQTKTWILKCNYDKLRSKSCIEKQDLLTPYIKLMHRGAQIIAHNNCRAYSNTSSAYSGIIMIAAGELCHENDRLCFVSSHIKKVLHTYWWLQEKKPAGRKKCLFTVFRRWPIRCAAFYASASWLFFLKPLILYYYISTFPTRPENWFLLDK